LNDCGGFCVIRGQGTCARRPRPPTSGRHRRERTLCKIRRETDRAERHSRTSVAPVLDFITGELLEIIDWTDDSRDTLSWQFPDDDKAIKNGAQLIVRESQVAQFVYLGQFGDTFGPGKHSLTTDNIPVLNPNQVVAVRIQLPIQGRRLLRHHAPLHRVGRVESGTAAGRRLRHGPAAGVRHLRLQDR
jgi:hypothetical protein